MTKIANQLRGLFNLFAHRLFFIFFVLSSAVLTPSSVFAHDGVDHDAPKAVVNEQGTPQGALRATAQSELFEVVLILQDKKLLIYLDSFDTNEPIPKAKIAFDGSTIKGQATETAPGVYSLDVATLVPAKHVFNMTIEAGESIDLLASSLDTSITTTPPAATMEHSHWPWLLGGVVLLVALVFLLFASARKPSFPFKQRQI
ncbi:MAG: hypothetical protein K2Y28_03220 [Burkholderiaceae bacterium]|nr:hypothetical protein [Burkholderiaceae bacterium]